MREYTADPQPSDAASAIEGTRSPAVGLSQLLTVARTGESGAVDELLRQAHAATEEGDLETPSAGTHYLLFQCEHVACAAPLAILREVLPAVPATIALPFSPPWLLGIFPLRSEMLGLIDPAPLLLDQLPTELPGAPPAAALVMGSGEESLALAVRAIGDILVVSEEDVRPGPLAATTGPQINPRYVLGTYAADENAQSPTERIVLLQAHLLLADALRALATDGSASHE